MLCHPASTSWCASSCESMAWWLKWTILAITTRRAMITYWKSTRAEDRPTISSSTYHQQFSLIQIPSRIICRCQCDELRFSSFRNKMLDVWKFNKTMQKIDGNWILKINETFRFECSEFVFYWLSNQQPEQQMTIVYVFEQLRTNWLKHACCTVKKKWNFDILEKIRLKFRYNGKITIKIQRKGETAEGDDRWQFIAE